MIHTEQQIERSHTYTFHPRHRCLHALLQRPTHARPKAIQHTCMYMLVHTRYTHLWHSHILLSFCAMAACQHPGRSKSRLSIPKRELATAASLGGRLREHKRRGSEGVKTRSLGAERKHHYHTKPEQDCVCWFWKSRISACLLFGSPSVVYALEISASGSLHAII
jgi:hypothetical protein